MKRRTFISLMSVMAAAGALSLAGCSSSKSASSAAANKLETVQSNGKLVVALEGAWQPWSFHDESGLAGRAASQREGTGGSHNAHQGDKGSAFHSRLSFL